jgi:hypothetical protein
MLDLPQEREWRWLRDQHHGRSRPSLKVQGKRGLGVWNAPIDGHKGSADQHYCKHCGTPLWVSDEQWPELVHPFASAIDTELPKAPDEWPVWRRSSDAAVMRDLPRPGSLETDTTWPSPALARAQRRNSRSISRRGRPVVAHLIPQILGDQQLAGHRQLLRHAPDALSTLCGGQRVTIFYGMACRSRPADRPRPTTVVRRGGRTAVGIDASLEELRAAALASLLQKRRRRREHE